MHPGERQFPEKANLVKKGERATHFEPKGIINIIMNIINFFFWNPSSGV